MTPPIRRYGPFSAIPTAWEEAESEGFSIASRDRVLAVPAGIEDPVEEDATVWVGRDHRDRTMLVVELPIEDARYFPDHLHWTEVKRFERQWTWPYWSERVSLSVPIAPADAPTFSAEEAEALLSAAVEGFELTERIEMLGLGRSRQTEVVVHRPIRAETLRTALSALASGVPLEKREN